MASPFEHGGIVVGKLWLLEANAVQGLPVLDSDGGMNPFGGHVLVEDVFDVVGAIGPVFQGSSHGIQECG